MSGEKPLDTRSIRLEITIPCDDRFRPVLKLLCERMARYVGYAEPEAAELAAMVAHATDGVLTHEESSGYTSLDVTIATSESEIEFRVRYLSEATGNGRRPTDIEHLLSQPRGNEAPLETMQRVMRRVEFGLDDGVEFCALSKALPDEL